MVLSHARALTNSAPEGGYVDAHIGNPGAIVAGAAATLACIADTAVAALAASLSSRSYVGLYHQTSELNPALHAGI
jgi:hypothetical protein